MIPKVILNLIQRIEPLYGYRVALTRGPWSGIEATIKGISRYLSNSGGVDTFLIDTDYEKDINLLYLDDIGMKVIGDPLIRTVNTVTLETIVYRNPKIAESIAKILGALDNAGYWLRYSEDVVDKSYLSNIKHKIYYCSKVAQNAKYTTTLKDIKTKEMKEIEKVAKNILGEQWSKLSKKSQNKLALKTLAILGKDLKSPSKAILWQSEEDSFSPIMEYPIRLAREKGIPIINLQKPNWREVFVTVFPEVPEYILD